MKIKAKKVSTSVVECDIDRENYPDNFTDDDIINVINLEGIENYSHNLFHNAPFKDVTVTFEAVTSKPENFIEMLEK